MRILCTPLLAAVLLATAAQAQSWEPAPAMPTPRAGAAHVVLDGRLYVLGGRDAAGTPLRTCEVFDPATGWASASDLRRPRADAAAVVLNGRIVLTGGRTSSSGSLPEDTEPTEDVEVYDAVEDRWESFQSLDEEREGHGVVVLGGRIYALGGAGEDGVLVSGAEVYTVASDEWAPYAPWSLQPPRALAGTAAVEGGLLTVGGFTAFGPVATVERFVPGMTTPEAELPLSVARGALAVAATDELVFAVGGRDASDAVRADVEVLDLSNRAAGWMALPVLPAPREGAVAVVLGSDLYVVGGADRFGGVLGSVVRFSVTSVSTGGGPTGRPGAHLFLDGPNPVRGLTRFRVQVPRQARARLAVYDARGREVALLLDADVPAGERLVTWRPEGLTSGVYLVRLTGLGAPATLPVTVIR